MTYVIMTTVAALMWTQSSCTVTTSNTTSTVGSPNCDTYHDCESCASSKTWTGSHCRWCPLTSDCHAEGSLENKCTGDEQITDSENCPSANHPSKPTMIHLALDGENGMTVTWATGTDTNAVVRFGTKGTAKTFTSTGSSVRLLKNWYHHVSLSGLEPGTEYEYECGDGNATWSATYSFVYRPTRSEGGFVASVFGDWGYGENGNAITTKRALDEIVTDADFVWHLGDIAYADDAFLHDITGFEYENIYDAWMNWIQENITTSTPYMVAVGNHESECHSAPCLADKTYRESLRNFSSYLTRWKMPFEKSLGRSNMWYSFDYGLAHFISINTEYVPHTRVHTHTYVCPLTRHVLAERTFRTRPNSRTATPVFYPRVDSDEMRENIWIGWRQISRRPIFRAPSAPGFLPAVIVKCTTRVEASTSRCATPSRTCFRRTVWMFSSADINITTREAGLRISQDPSRVTFVRMRRHTSSSAARVATR